jgi:hypothetical protein
MLLFAISISSASTNYYVATGGDDDANGLTWDTAFETIQRGIDEANDGDSITVEVGLYLENIDFKGKSIIVSSTNPDSWYTVESTVIDANDRDYVAKFSNSEDSNAVLTGFTIRNGYYGLYCGSSSTPVISRCVIKANAKAAYIAGSPLIINNKISGNVEGLSCLNNAEPIVKNNFIYDSYYGLLCWNITQNPEIHNNTIVNNSVYGVAVYTDDSNRPVVTNSILWDNADDLKDCNATYSCIEDINDANGVGNITTNPEFADSNNYHISPYSPCIDKGDPNTEYDANALEIDTEPRFIDGDKDSNTVIDIGADEYDYRDEDFNSDGIVNFIDYAMFASAWLSTPNDANNYNDTYDFQDNNSIDYNDLEIFINEWLWEAGWRVPMSMYGEGYMMMGGGDMNKSASSLESSETGGLTSEEIATAEIPTKEEREAVIKDIIEWLVKMWEEDEEFRKVMTEADMKEFLESIVRELDYDY